MLHHHVGAVGPVRETADGIANLRVGPLKSSHPRTPGFSRGFTFAREPWPDELGRYVVHRDDPPAG